MEDHSSVDISIRKVAVRLNDSNINSEMNGDCVSYSSGENESTCFNEEAKSLTKHSGITKNFEDKLHICNEPSGPLLNGCNKLLHEDIQNMGFSTCNNNPTYGIIKTENVAKSSERTHSEQTTSKQETERTNELTPEQFIRDINVVRPLINSYDITAGQDESITYLGYESESQMPDIMRLIQKDLSEPYSIYTYRYFIHNWPKLCFLVSFRLHVSV